MKIKFTFLLMVATMVSLAQLPNPLNFNTATNATNNGTIPLGANDLNWQAALSNSLGPYVPAVSCSAQSCCWMVSPYANANWITYPHKCSSDPSEHSCLGHVDEYFKLAFDLPALTCRGSIITPSACCLAMNFFADNWVHQIFVNGYSSYLNPNTSAYGAMGFIATSGVTISLCYNWQAGANNVIVHLKSGAPSYPGWAGFLATAAIKLVKCTGIRDIINEKQNINIFPNPVTHFVYVTKDEGNKIKKIQVYNSLSDLIKTSAGQENFVFDVSNFPAGIYFFKIELDDGIELNYKIIRD